MPDISSIVTGVNTNVTNYWRATSNTVGWSGNRNVVTDGSLAALAYSENNLNVCYVGVNGSGGSKAGFLIEGTLTRSVVNFAFAIKY